MLARKLNNGIITITALGLIILGLSTSIVYEGFASTNSGQDISIVEMSKKQVEAQTRGINTSIGIETDTMKNITNTFLNNVETGVSSAVSRESIISTKVNSFITSKTLHPNSIMTIEPYYDSENKMFISSRAESMCLDIREPSNWTADDFYSILNEEMYDLVPVALRLEKEVGINAIYIIAVGANETGWGKSMAGDYNYFNWTNDAVYHFDFDSIDDFADFSIDTYKNYYIHEDFYEAKLGFVPEHITPEVVNVKYALNKDGTTNWQWSNVVCEIMSDLCSRKSS